MIKKFENFENKKVDTEYITNAFVEFIDDGCTYEKDEKYFEIFIDMPGIRSGERKWEKNPKIESYLSASKKQTELLEDINVSIKRIYDEFKIFPKITEEDYEHSETGLVVWYLRITYEL
jgi:replicative superfamily II helicase